MDDTAIIDNASFDFIPTVPVAWAFDDFATIRKQLDRASDRAAPV
jgi:hypothetical protein